MNTLSIFLWAADVLPGISNNLQALGAMLGIVMAFGTFVSVINEQFHYLKFTIPILCFAVLISVAAALVPKKETIYAIAVSELGEEVYKSEEGQKVVRLLNGYLDKKLEEMGAKEPKK